MSAMRWWLLGLMACSESPASLGITQVLHQDFELEVRREIDLLIVVDRSPGMEDHRDTIRAAMPGFANALATLGRVPDLHVGFISSNCERGALRAAAASDGRFLTDVKRPDGTREHNFDGDLGTAMLASLEALEPGCPEHAPLPAVIAALGDPVNHGFLRDEAELAIVLLTASDDESSLAVAEAARVIRAAERDPSRVVVGGVFGPCRVAEPLRAARPTPRLRAFFEQFPNRATITPICQQDVSGVLSGLAELTAVTSDPCAELALPEPPACVAWLVRDGGEILLPACEGQEDECWDVVDDPVACPSDPQQRLFVGNFVPSAKHVRAVFECVVR